MERGYKVEDFLSLEAKEVGYEKELEPEVIEISDGSGEDVIYAVDDIDIWDSDKGDFIPAHLTRTSVPVMKALNIGGISPIDVSADSEGNKGWITRHHTEVRRLKHLEERVASLEKENRKLQHYKSLYLDIRTSLKVYREREEAFSEAFKRKRRRLVKKEKVVAPLPEQKEREVSKEEAEILLNNWVE